ncbi:MAG: efflux transporter periplasmic adaptor subunit, partial [Rhizobium sp.]|nr:efflux transporter periplasmic adaptor subunit [Rhizobium sp.]
MTEKARRWALLGTGLGLAASISAAALVLDTPFSRAAADPEAAGA